MKRKLIAFVAVLGLSVSPAVGQWASTVVTGGTQHLGTFHDTVKVDASKLRITMLDTTITANASVKKIISFNLHDPNQLGRYNSEGHLVSMFDQLRSQELNNSLHRDEQILLPADGLVTIADGADTVVVWNGSDMTHSIDFVVGGSKMISGTPSGLVFLDGTLFVSEASHGLKRLDFLADQYIAHQTTGVRFSGNSGGGLTRRNQDDGTLLMNASPAIVNNTVNAVAVTRSPFAGTAGTDQFGRQNHYWRAGTDGGTSSARYNGSGILVIDDHQTTPDGNQIALLPNGGMLVINEGATRDELDWWYSSISATGDGHAVSDTWTNQGAGSEDLIWSDAAVFSGIGTLPCASASGNCSGRNFLASDEGLYILDAKATDNTNGTKKLIDATHNSLPAYGATVVAWSGASSADLSGQSKELTEVGSVTYSSANNSPTGRYVDFVGNATQGLRRLGDTDFNLGTGDWSIAFWYISTDENTGNSTLVVLSDNANDWIIFRLDQDNSDVLEFVITDDNFVSEDKIDTPFNDADLTSSGFHFVVGQRLGSNFTLYFDGELVGSTAVSLAAGSLDPDDLEIGIETLTNWGGFSGRIAGLNLNVTQALPVAVIKEMYQNGRAHAETANDGLLTTGGDVDYLQVDPISHRVVLGDEATVEIRDSYGALLDTLKCTDCGTLADATLLSYPGLDSIAVAFGGSSGMRVVAPDPRAVDMAAFEWPLWSEYWIGNGPAVVDSTGYGHFWTDADALAAISNVSPMVSDVLIRTGQRAGTKHTEQFHHTEPLSVTLSPKVAGTGTADSVFFYQGSIDGLTDDNVVTVISGLDSTRAYDLRVSIKIANQTGTVSYAKNFALAAAPAADVDQCGFCEVTASDVSGTTGTNGKFTTSLRNSGATGIIEFENRTAVTAEVLWSLRGGG